MSTRKIDAWHAEGLIDADTRARLIAYEQAHSRPLALWAVYGIGALAIGLGLISVVAANWDDIPGQVRLAAHFGLIGGALAALAWTGKTLDAMTPWAGEVLPFVVAILGLTFFGHIGQVYQTGSPLWQPIGVWLLLFAPLVLFSGRSWLTALLIFGFFAYACWNFGLREPIVRSARASDWVELAVITSMPVLVAPFAAWMRDRSARPEFFRRLEQLAVAYAIGGASFIAALASVTDFADEKIGAAPQFVRFFIALACAAGVFLARRGRSGQMTAAILAGAGTVFLIAPAVSGTEALSGLLFLAFWTGCAAAALVAGWRTEFQIAVAVIALRLIILSFELASDLLLSGFGLILSGVLVLGIGYAAVRVSKAFAPPAEGDIE